jgi:catechol 2,3-dioxygenase-like lactoylglutathione lyase family enzyme
MAHLDGFHHVAVRSADFDRSVALYTQALGMTPAVAWGQADKRAILLDAGGGNFLEIFSREPLDAPQDGALLHFALQTDDVDAMTEAVRRAGCEITTEPRDVEIPSEPPLHVRLSFFTGPDGETVELFQVRD